MTDFAIYKKNENRANELQKQYGLTETLHDLYAWEELTEAEAVGIQQYRDRTYPTYTGEVESDLKLQEAFEAKVASWDISESQLVDAKAKSLYESFCLDLDEALELQKIRNLTK
jgi:hypothetical protein